MAISPTEIRDWTIYLITNPKGRIYIGKSADYAQRLRNYKCFLGKGQPLIRASLLKYGFDNHTFDVIDTFKSTGEYCAGKEIFWIRSYMSNKSKFPKQNGMNLTEGGEGSLGAKKSDKFREECRQRNIGKKRTKEWKDNMAIFMTGNKYSLGVKQSPETIEKRAAKLRGVKYDEARRGMYHELHIKNKGKPIIQIDEHGFSIREFPAIAVAQRKLSVNNIFNEIAGKIKHTKGLHFKYKYNARFAEIKMKRREFKLIDVGHVLNKAI